MNTDYIINFPLFDLFDLNDFKNGRYAIDPGGNTIFYLNDDKLDSNGELSLKVFVIIGNEYTPNRNIYYLHEKEFDCCSLIIETVLLVELDIKEEFINLLNKVFKN